MLEINGSHELAEGLALVLVFVALSVPIIIICLFSYLKKRLEHKQILAAIEKGIPPQQISKTVTPAGPRWIKSLTNGIAILLIAVILLAFWLKWNVYSGLPAVILSAIGLSLVIRGLLLRKAEAQQNQAQKNIPSNDVS